MFHIPVQRTSATVLALILYRQYGILRTNLRAHRAARTLEPVDCDLVVFKGHGRAPELADTELMVFAFITVDIEWTGALHLAG